MDGAGILGDVFVRRDEGDLLALGLGDQHAVEGVAVEMREMRDGYGVGSGD